MRYHRGPAQSGKRETARPGRRRTPCLEGLESRLAPALTIQNAIGLAATGTVGDILANAVAHDPGGDILVAGSFQGTVNFDPAGGSSGILSSSGFRDGFLARYQPGGALVYARRLAGASGNALSQISALAVGSSGQVTFAGSFSGTVDFDPGAGVANRSSPGRTDPFVARFDAQGNFVWSNAAAGPTGSNNQAYAVTVDSSGNAYLAGSLQGSLGFGTLTATSQGFFEAFITRVSPAGQFEWVRATSGTATSSAEIRALAIDASGRLVAGGFVAGAVGFESSGVVSSRDRTRDALVWVLNSSGSSQWVRSFGSTDFDQTTAVAYAANGDILATGAFTGAVDFDPGQASVTLDTGGAYDPFVVRLDSTGNLIWARSLDGSTGASQGNGIRALSTGGVVVAGLFQGTVDFDPGPPTTTVTSRAGGFDGFVLELDASGTFDSVVTPGGSGFDAIFGLSVDSIGRVATAGTYSGPATFGPATLPSRPTRSLALAMLASSSVAPPAPEAPTLQPSSNTAGGGPPYLTAVNRPVFDVSGVSLGSTLELLRNGQVVATRSGSGAIADPGPVPDGLHTYSARQISSAGTPSDPSGGVSVRIDTTAPAIPGVLQLVTADDSGAPGDFLTNVNRPRLLGTAEAGARVRLLDQNGSLLASTTADGSGLYQLQWPSALPDGPTTFQIQAVDAALNISPVRSGSLTIQTSPPPIPTGLSLDPRDDSGIAGDRLTNLPRPRLTATAGAGLTVVLRSGTAVLASAVAGADGAVVLLPVDPLPEGETTLDLQATDLAGNVSGRSASLLLRIRTTAPAIPWAPQLLPEDDSGNQGDNLTRVSRPRLTGTVAAGQIVRLLSSSDLQVLGTATANGSGVYTVSPSSNLADGVAEFRVQVVDEAGNVSQPSTPRAVTIVTGLPPTPSAPTLDPQDDSGTQGDRITNVARPSIQGTATAGYVVQLTDASTNTNLASGVVGADGRYRLAPTNDLLEGVTNLVIRQADPAGNLSLSSPVLSLTTRRTRPGTPTNLGFHAGDDSGVPGDRLTNVNRPRFLGLATAGIQIELRSDSGTVLAIGFAAPDGLFTLVPDAPLLDGTQTLSASAIDVAGNRSVSSLPLTIQIRTALPDAPTNLRLLDSDDTGTKGDGVTRLRQPGLVVEGTPGTTIQLLDAENRIIGTVRVGDSGSAVVVPVSPFADGSRDLRARILDDAGNRGPAGSAFRLTVLATPPARPGAPSLFVADDSGTVGDGLTRVDRPRFTGTAPGGLVVQLLNDSGSVLASASQSVSGSFTLGVTGALPDGIHAFRTRLLDVAGNLSEPSLPLSIRIKTSAPQPGTISLVSADDTGIVGDRVTSARRPGFSGRTGGTGRVELVSNAGVVLGSAQSDASGNFVVRPAGPLAVATHSLRIRITDAAGNTGPFSAATVVRIIRPVGDFDGDGRSDLVVFRPSTGETFYQRSRDGATATAAIGQRSGDLPVPADYDGDGRSDVAVYRASNSTFYIALSANSQTLTVAFGRANSDQPIAGDFDGDGKADLAVFRRSTSTFFVRNSANGTTRSLAFGRANVDLPIPGDYDGDGRTDFAVFRPTDARINWISSITGRAANLVLGQSTTDVPIVGDYDGDGKTDFAVFRRNTSTFLIRRSSDGTLRTSQYGRGGSDLAVPGADYDGDGRADLAVYRPSTSTFYIQLSGNGSSLTIPFGRRNSDQSALSPAWLRS